MTLTGRIVFGILAAIALVKLVDAREPMVSWGHIVALWGVCWFGMKLTERGWLWLPIGLFGFGVGWVMLPVLPAIALYILERASRPSA